MAGSLTDMISLRRARYDELEKFCAWDLQAHARRFVTGGSLEIHQRDFPKDNTHYLAIVDAAGELIGYFLLRVESGGDTVEFHRIVIDRGARGVGQQAILRMLQFCREDLGASKVWLDVFDDNPRGIHIYEKLGFRWFKSEPAGGRTLHFYRKSL